jgi:carboxymethylenebutenolidase
MKFILVQIYLSFCTQHGGITLTRLTAKDFDPKLLELYDFYTHGMISKRQFLDRAGKFVVAGMTATAVLGMMSPNYALAEQVSFNDPNIVPEYIMYPSPNWPR